MKRILFTLLTTILFSTVLFSQNALDFDGVDDYVNTTCPGVSGNGDRTIELWTKAPMSSKQKVLIDWGAFSTGARFTFCLMDGKPRIEISGSGYTSTKVVADNKWHHIAISYDNKSTTNKYCIYIDGIKTDSFNLSTTLNTSKTIKVKIGNRVDNSRPFLGIIDEVRIWDTVRTSKQIADNKDLQFCGKTDNLIGYYSFNHGDASSNNTGIKTLKDYSGNSYDGTLTGFSLSGTSSNWVAGATITKGTGSSSTINPTACKTYLSPGGKLHTTSGTYKDTISSIYGCDSIITINLTIVNNSTTNTISPTECNSYTSPSGKLLTSSGTYKDTIPNYVGCDSIITINLTINKNPTRTINAIVCGSYTSPSGKIYTTSNTYTDTIVNTVGCDSVITINLTVNQPTTSTINTVVCGSYNTPSGKTLYLSGTYTDTIPNTIGCDSIITINLTVNQPSSSTINEIVCESYTSPSGKIWTTTGTYTDTIPNSSNCDSVITINLKVNQITYSTINEVGCRSYTSPSGKIWTVSDTYVDTIPNINGCDSIITINLVIENLDTSVIVDVALGSEYQLTSNDSTANYQWINCSDHSPVTGETNRIFAPKENGFYAVIVSRNGCTDTSKCYEVIGIGIEDVLKTGSFEIFPNPGNGNINIRMNSLNENIYIDIIDLSGKLIFSKKYSNANTLKVDISDYSKGIYFIKIKNNNEIHTQKYIIK